MVSKTTTDWHVLDTLLFDDTGFAEADSVRYTGFHYVDWQFDGAGDRDIIYAVRTSYRGANSYHNSNRITFKRLVDFRASAIGLLGIGLGEAALQPPFARNVTSYTAQFPANTTSITVTLNALDTTGATVNGVAAPTGEATLGFPLALPSTTITVIVQGTRYVVECRRVRPSILRLSGSGFEIARLCQGGTAWLNREYIWNDVPPALSGLSFTRISGGAGTKGAPTAKIRVDGVDGAGTIFAALGDCDGCSDVAALLLAAGWRNSSLSLRYSDSVNTRLWLLEKSVAAGAPPFEVPERNAGWYGVTLVFP